MSGSHPFKGRSILQTRASQTMSVFSTSRLPARRQRRSRSPWLTFTQGSFHYPAAQLDGRPYIDAKRRGCYFTYGPGIYFQDARGKEPEKIVEIPPEVIKHRQMTGIASHLLRNASGRRFALTGRLGAKWFVGYADVKERKIKFLH